MATISIGTGRAVEERVQDERPVDEHLTAVVARTATRMSTTAQWASVLVATFTVFGYLVSADMSPTAPSVAVRVSAIFFGIAVGVLLWAIGAALTNRLVLPARANAASYGDLRSRMAADEAELDRLSRTPGAALDVPGLRKRLHDLDVHLNATNPDATWSLGEAYVIRWRELHALEEALIGHAATCSLDAVLLHDELRVEGSKLNRKGSIVRDQIARAKSQLKTDAGRDEGCEKGDSLRSLLREIRTAVDDYRDRRYEALVRARKALDDVSLLLGVTAWALLALAILTGATPTAVAWVSALYLVGVGAGLLTQLRSSGDNASREDVYGYAQAHLRRIVLVSGLAGIGGVFLTSVVGAGDLEGLVAFPISASAVLTAAAFGLAPGVLFERLGTWAKTNLDDLESTRAGKSRPTEVSAEDS